MEIEPVKNPGTTIYELILDNLEEICYLADPVTYELAYLNKAGRRAYGFTEQLSGQKCYEILQGRNRKCDFCTNHMLAMGNTYSWEYYNPVLNRHFFFEPVPIEDFWGLLQTAKHLRQECHHLAERTNHRNDWLELIS